MANYYSHNLMTARELSQALTTHEMTLDDFIFLTGYTRDQARGWMQPHCDSPHAGEDIPHIVAVFFELLKLGAAKQMAFDLSRRLVKPRSGRPAQAAL